MFRYRPVYGISLLFAGVVLAAVGYWFTRHESARADAPPAFAGEREVNLGPLERGSVADARFRVTNAGGGQLVLDTFRTDCSCEGVDVEVRGEFYQLTALKLAPGEAATIRYRTVVRSPANQPFQSVVRCRSNDPAAPEVALVVTIPFVIGGLSADPPQLTLGVLKRGQSATGRVDLYDTAVPPRAVTAVASDDPGRVTAEFRPAEGTPEVLPDGRRRVGAIHFAVATGQLGEFSTQVRYASAGATVTPDPVRVAGRVAAPVEATPRELFFPRASAAGPVYAADCLIRSETGERFDLEPAAGTPGLRVVVHPATGGPYRRVTVTADPARRTPLAVAHLVATVGERAHPVDIAVRCDLPGDAP